MKKILLISVIFLSITVSWSKPCVNKYGYDRGDPDKDQIKCDNGDGEACNNLANLYFFGECGKQKDALTGHKLLDKACDLSHHQSCVYIAELYYGKNEIKVADYWAKGCKRGSNYEVCEAAINKYFKYNVYEKGIKLLEYTCDKGFSSSCQKLNNIKNISSPQTNKKWADWTNKYRNMYINKCTKDAPFMMCKCFQEQTEKKYPNLYDYTDVVNNGSYNSFLKNGVYKQCVNKVNRE